MIILIRIQPQALPMNGVFKRDESSIKLYDKSYADNDLWYNFYRRFSKRV